MTNGKMVLQLLIDAKSAITFFDQSEASFGSHMTRIEASDWPIFFDSGIILKKNSQKTNFWGPFHKFFQGSLITF